MQQGSASRILEKAQALDAFLNRAKLAMQKGSTERENLEEVRKIVREISNGGSVFAEPEEEEQAEKGQGRFPDFWLCMYSVGASFEPERALTYAQYLMLLPSLARWCGLGRRAVDSLRFAIETYLRVRIPNRGGGSVLTREEAEAILSVEEREKEIEERPLSLLVHDYASVIGSSTTLDRQTVYAAILNDLLHHLEETAAGMQRRRSWTSRRRFKIATVDSLESRVQKLASCSRSVRRIVRRYFTRRLKPQSLSITVYTDGKLASRQHAVEEPGIIKEEDAEDTAESIIMGRRTKRKRGDLRSEENGEKQETAGGLRSRRMFLALLFCVHRYVETGELHTSLETVANGNEFRSLFERHF